MARPTALGEVGAAYFVAGRADKGKLSLIDAQGVVPAPPKEALRTRLLEILAKDGLSQPAEALGAASGAAIDRALMAVAARGAGDRHV